MYICEFRHLESSIHEYRLVKSALQSTLQCREFANILSIFFLSNLSISSTLLHYAVSQWWNSVASCLKVFASRFELFRHLLVSFMFIKRHHNLHDFRYFRHNLFYCENAFVDRIKNQKASSLIKFASLSFAVRFILFFHSFAWTERQHAVQWSLIWNDWYKMRRMLQSK